jgi:acetyl esterase/lipase
MRLLWLLLVASAAFGQNYRTVENVQYCTGGGRPLLMDIFLPAIPARNPTPAVLWLHGGGWERGDKNGSSGALLLAGAGFATTSLYYRLSGDAKFPAQIEDVKCAIRYLRSHAADYGIDPDSIGIAGASSGGHLALLVGAAGPDARLEGSGGWAETSSRVRAVCSYYGPTDFSAFMTEYGERGRNAIRKLVGLPPGNTDAYKRASPISYVTRDMPPVLMFHGDSDQLVPHTQSERMLAALQRAGGDAQLITVGNADHDFAPFAKDKPLSISEAEIHGITIAFFRKWLLPAVAR